MWILQSVTGDKTYHLLMGKEYTVGRKDADILLPDDMSVSRAHAALSVLHSEVNLSNPKKLAALKLQEKSKFGSLLNDAQIMGQNRELKDGDIIKFGTQKSIFRVVHEDFTLTTSCLDLEGKRSVRSLVMKLGGHVTNDWQPGTRFLVMNTLSVTVKVICALVCQKHIVTPQYLQQYLTALSSKKSQPPLDPNNFQPVLGESQLDPSEVSFAPNERRSTLFQGRIFIFMSPKQFKKLSQVVELAGGMPMLLEDSSDADEMLSQPQTCVMQCEAADTKSAAWFTTVVKLLKKYKRRMIPDSEIGYAVLYCSVDKYCNPEENAANMPDLPSQTLSQQILDSEQQTSQVVQRSDGRTKISPNSQVRRMTEEPLSQGSPRLGKRPRTDYSEDTGVMNPPKQAKVPTRPVKEEVTAQSKKRTNIFDDSDETNIDQSMQSEPKREKVFSPVPDTEMVSPDQSRLGHTDVTTSAVDDTIIKTPEESIQINKGKHGKDLSPKKKPALPRESPMVTRSRSPSPVPGGTRGQVDRSPKGSTRSSSRSPSPVPGRRRPIRGTVAKDTGIRNIEVKSERKSKSKSPSPVPEVAEVSPGGELEKRGRTKDFVSHSASPRHGRRAVQVSPSEESSVKSRSPSPGPSIGFKRRKNEVSDVKEEGAESKRNARLASLDASEKSRERIEILKKSPPTPKISSRMNGGKESPRSANRSQHHNGSEPSLSVVKVENDTDVKPRTSLLQNGALPEGFLTTVAPISDQVAPNKEYLDENQPQQMIQTKFESLVARQPGKKKSTSGVTIEDGYTMWNGKRVRNFKKFSKTKNIGAERLPTIIGGTDLEVHRSKANRDLDDWVRDAMEAESQDREQDRLSRELFDFAPRKQGRGRRV